MSHLAFVLCGLPGPAYHGGAVTCWSIIKEMIARGHEVTVISLFDNSEGNPYLSSKEAQVKDLVKLGARVSLLEFNDQHLSFRQNTLLEKIGIVFQPDPEKFFPWARLRSEVQKKLAEIKPSAVFCYHFDALSSVYGTDIAPVMAGVGDLLHMPPYFSWKGETPSLKKYIIGYLSQRIYRELMRKFMVEMLGPCARKGAFAAHYADWLGRQKGLSDVLYLRTPAHDPVGGRWRELRNEHLQKVHKPRILMIGDITGTASKWGLRLLMNDVLPMLEKRFGAEGFDIHLVGGGKVDGEFLPMLDRPAVKMRGRVVPPDAEFLSSHVLFVPTPIPLGIRVRIITGFSYGSCVVAHTANRAGIPEITHEDNALVSGSGEGLGREIIRALEDDKLRERLEGGARRTFETYFSERTAAASIVRTMEEISKS